MNHARLSPSSSSRWLNCTASVKASEKYENKTNASAEWGTKVHYIGEKLLDGNIIEVNNELEDVENNTGKFIVDKEMLDCAEEYFDYVTSYIKANSVVLVEEQFDLSSISAGQFGTSDCTVLTDKHIHIFDLKTGHNIVGAKENSQLMLYAIGAVDELEAIYDIDEITLHIVQTRAGHIDDWTLSYSDLMDFKELAKQKAHEILMDKVSFTPSTKACKWCPHKQNCEALDKHIEETVKGAFEDIDEDNDRIKHILDNVDLIQDYIKSIQELALDKLEAGEKIEGYKLVEARTNRKWTDEAEVAEYLDSLDDGVDYYQPRKLLPMTKVLKTLKNDDNIHKFIYKPDGKPTVAPAGDKRKEINPICGFDT